MKSNQISYDSQSNRLSLLGRNCKELLGLLAPVYTTADFLVRKLSILPHMCFVSSRVLFCVAERFPSPN